MSDNAAPQMAPTKDADVSPNAEPNRISKQQALQWVQNVIMQTRYELRDEMLIESLLTAKALVTVVAVEVGLPKSLSQLSHLYTRG